MDFVDEFYKDEDLSLLKKLTLVIPTYNRNYYLSRCLWYHAHFPFGQIIVADSSPEEKKIVNRETVEKVRKKFKSDILYLEYPPETEKMGGDIYRKWGDAVKHVENQYSQFCADKEFTIPTTICKGIKFLDEHPDYGSADGIYYNTKSRSKNKRMYIEGCKNEKGWPTKCSLPFTNAIERYLVCTTRTNASQNLLSIHRAELHKEVYSNIIKNDLCDIRFGEIVTEFMTIIKAKHHYFSDDPYNCRDITNVVNKKGLPNLTESSASRYPLLDQYIKDGIYEDYFKRTVDCMRDEMIKSGSDLYPEEIEDIINKTLPASLDRRFFYGVMTGAALNTTISEKLRSNPITKTLIFPIAKKVYDKLTKSDDEQINNLPHELKIVDTVINTFKNYYENDTPII